MYLHTYVCKCCLICLCVQCSCMHTHTHTHAEQETKQRAAALRIPKSRSDDRRVPEQGPLAPKQRQRPPCIAPPSTALACSTAFGMVRIASSRYIVCDVCARVYKCTLIHTHRAVHAYVDVYVRIMYRVLTKVKDIYVPIYVNLLCT